MDRYRGNLAHMFVTAIVSLAMTFPLLSCDGREGGDEEDGLLFDVIEPKRETRHGMTIVWLSGTPYEMGKQHGELMREELAEGVEEVEDDLTLMLMFQLAREAGLVELAQELSTPEMLEECQGMVDGAGDVGWTMEHCLVLNFGDVIAEFLTNGLPEEQDFAPGCAQVVATGDATPDGTLVHGRILDWAKIDFLLNHPTVFVRQPKDEIAHVIIGFPGNLSPYQGMNAAGLSAASNEIDPLDSSVDDMTGESHVQLLGRILSTAESLEDAEEMVRATNHMANTVIVVSDSRAGTAAVFEMSPKKLTIRRMHEDAVYVTNHFVGEGTSDLDADPIPESSLARWNRLEQLIPSSGSDSRYGSLDVEGMIRVLRDREDPESGEVYPTDVFDNNRSLATNGAMYQVVFTPRTLEFWVAAGALPVPSQPFVGFSLAELLEATGYEGPPPATID